MAETFASTGSTVTFYMHPDVEITAPSLLAERYVRTKWPIPYPYVVDQSGQGLRHINCTSHISAGQLWNLHYLVGSYGTLTWVEGSWGVVLLNFSASNFKYRVIAADLYTAKMEFSVVST